MSKSHPVRALTAAAVLASVPLVASAQTQSSPPPTTPPPSATKPDAAPTPMPPATRPTPPAPSNRSTTAPGKANPLVGLAVFSADGSKLGAVQSVDAEPDGKVKAIRIKTGGFLGFGGKLVAIPDGKFTKTGDNLQLSMTADEVSKLPEVKEQS
jgi:hypothetical protein